MWALNIIPREGVPKGDRPLLDEGRAPFLRSWQNKPQCPPFSPAFVRLLKVDT